MRKNRLSQYKQNKLIELLLQVSLTQNSGQAHLGQSGRFTLKFNIHI